MVLGFTLRFLIHFELIFLYYERYWIYFLFCTYIIKLFLQYLLKRLCFSHWIAFASCQKSVVHICLILMSQRFTTDQFVYLRVLKLRAVGQIQLAAYLYITSELNMVLCFWKSGGKKKKSKNCDRDHMWLAKPKICPPWPFSEKRSQAWYIFLPIPLVLTSTAL